MTASRGNDPRPNEDDIAIVGLGCLFPGSQDRHGYWAGLRSGEDHIEEIPPGYWDVDDYHDPDKSSPDRTYGKRGAFLSPIPFHPLEYGITPRDLEATDTSQLLGLVAAKQALEDAGYDATRTFDRSKASVILGVTGALELVVPLGARLGHPHWWKALREAGVEDDVAREVVRNISEGYVDWQENSFPGLLGNVVAGRIANRLDLHGTNCVTDAACASSLAAVHLASMELKSGRSDMVITGGVDTFNDIFMYMCFSKTPALSATGDARPFDADGDGTVLGEGLGVLVLKRLSDAERDGDRIYAKLLSVGTSSDGKGSAIYAPTSPGQQRALNDAYSLADINPSTIEMVEAHGTGTAVGDATELKALDEIYRQSGTRPGSVALGSVKSQIGHTKAAAGAAGLIKAVLSLHHKVQPPSLKIRRPLEELGSTESPFHVEESARPWVRRPDSPRRAAVSSFGFGGSNFHAVLEEHSAKRAEVDWSGLADIFAFSAHSPTGLADKLSQSISNLKEDDSSDSLEASARESRNQFQPTDTDRIVITVPNGGDAKILLQQALQTLRSESSTSWSLPSGIERGNGLPNGKLAIVFPGQGSQRIQMCRSLACHFPGLLEVLDQAEASFWSPNDQKGLSEVIWPPRNWQDLNEQLQAELRRTNIAQPALGATSLGMYRILEGLGVQGDLFAGHSFGELTALAAANRVSPSDFHQLANFRGRLMAEAGGDDAGTMLAVQLPLGELERLVHENWPHLVVANRNAPEQAVLSGPTSAIDAARKDLENRGVRCIPLPVSAAFHSNLVSSAASPFEEVLEKVRFETGTRPVYSNTTATPYPTETEECRKMLAHQIAQPVLFKEMIEEMIRDGASTFVEVGPGKILTGLIRSIASASAKPVYAINTESDEPDGRSLARALAVIACRGHVTDLRLWKPKALSSPKERKGPVVFLRGANLKPGEGLPGKEKRAVPEAPQHLPQNIQTSAKEKAPLSDTAASNSHADAPVSKIAAQENVTHSHTESTALLDQQEALMDAIEKALETRRILDAVQKNAELALEHSLSGTEIPLELKAPVKAEAQVFAEEIIETHDDVVFETPVNVSIDTQVAAPAVDSPVSSQEQSLRTFLTQVISEKTGYPTDAIGPEMDLEADLGIDSIKRVEILSALRQARPELPSLEPETLGSLRTMTALVSRFLESSPDSLVHQGSHAPIETPSVDASNSKEFGSNDSLATLLIEVVAEKTGYPVEAIGTNLDLEADLGIDSIKRVEILSSLRQRKPELTALPPETLGSLRTIDAIIEYYAGAEPEEVQHSSELTISETVSTETHDHPPHSLINTLVEIVAEKTGYPASAIGTDLDLEADLGIDSIKRVEILSALRQQDPTLPTLPPETLGSLRTIDALAKYLGSDSVSNDDSDRGSTQATSAEQSPSDDVSLIPLMVTIIAEKTGYPEDAIGIELDLEADLGIDSIKRVEILSALRQEIPELPTLAPELLGSLRSIRLLSEALSESGSAPEKETPVDLGEISPQSVSTDTNLTDLTSILVRVVSEKTGYPEDAIGIDLDLEADLGIDSIKRVEILSALREHKPDLQAIPADKLGTLRSIEAISGWYTTSTESSPASTESFPAIPHAVESPLERKEEKNGSRPIVATPVITELPSLDLSSEIELDTKNSWWLICDDESIRVAVEKELSNRSVHVISLPSHSEIPSRSNDSALGGMILIGNKTTLSNDALTSFRWLREAGKRLGNDAQGHASIHLVSRMDGQFGLSGKQDCGDPNSGHLLGLARCACREWPEFVVRGIDISSETAPAVVSKTLVQEIFHGEEMEVGLHSQGRCHTLLQKEETTGTALPRLSEGDLVVVTGGARGVTAACVDALTRTVRPSLLLLGRTPEPGDEPEWARGIKDQDLESRLFQQAGTNHSPAEVRSIAKSVLQSRDIGRRIEELERWGSSVTYRSLDVRNTSDLSRTLEEARALYGPVRGLIHGAGVLSDGWIVEKSDDQFLQVWSTKIEPALQLLELFKNDDLKILNFFSSTTASLGRKGQSDYAAANEVLNQLALRESQRRPHCHVRSLGWGPWDGGMVAEGLKDLFHSEGVGLISLTEGSNIFVEKLSTESPVHQIVISPFAEDANFLETIQSWPGPDRQRKRISTTSIIETEKSVDIHQSDKKRIISSPSGSGDEMELGLEMQISCEKDPSLRHHVLHGRAVVPAALLLEWCTQVAIHRHPGLQLLGVDDFKILKGVVLDSQQSMSLSIFTGKPESTSDALYIPVEIRTTGEQGRIHAKTRVLLGDREHTSSRIAANGIATSFVYDEQLFHGESYRCITKIVGLSDSGIAFSASGTPAPGELFRSPLLPEWRIDPLRIDAIFQGLIIWSRKNAGSPCLPCAIEKLRIHRDIQSGHLETRIEIDTFDPSTASASAEILDHNGIPIMTISGAEVIIDGALEDAFSNQQLSEEAHP